jgi:hypothetical protein
MEKPARRGQVGEKALFHLRRTLTAPPSSSLTRNMETPCMNVPKIVLGGNWHLRGPLMLKHIETNYSRGITIFSTM